jgi:Flp pilus assembly pilin Flp
MEIVSTLRPQLGRRLDDFVSDASGQALVEYALLISLVALLAFGAVQAFGISLFEMYSRIEGRMP